MCPPPHASPIRRSATTLSCLALAAGALTAISAAGSAAAQPTTPSGEIVRMASTGSMHVYWRGNGHGHGMSQYGARGAAMQGRSTSEILSFYYPGTTLRRLAASTIRVRISAATAATTVLRGPLQLSGYGTLPTSGYGQFRLAPSADGLKLQGHQSAGWKTLKAGLPARADFSSSNGWVQLLLSDGTSTRYRGTVGAVRDGSGELTVNRVSLDAYTQGVAPREMPSSWEIAAVRAQAIAARTYAKSSMNAAGGGGSYDICDTTMCQVYGGMAHYNGSGQLLYADYPDAIAGRENMVLTYQGGPIFAQYSASNGGASTDGGKPYLVGRNDPFDTAASGDPYLDEQNLVSVATLASRYGLRSVTSIEVTGRDGNGPWGGRIETAYVNGTTNSGGSAHVSTTGFELGANLGVYTDYLRLTSATSVPSRPTAVTATAGDAGARLSWGSPASTGNLAISGYRIRFADHTFSVPAKARSAWVGPLANARATSLTVQALNAQGAGPAATLSVTPNAAPRRIVAVTPARLFDTGSIATVIDKTHPFRFAFAGHGSIPQTGATSVQLAITVVQPSSSGVLTIAPSGVHVAPLATVAYRAGHSSVTTVSVPLIPSSTLVFTPSAGRLELHADQQSYTAATGSLIRTASRQEIATVHDVPTGAGAVLSLAGLAGITATTKGVLIAVDATTRGTPTTLRVWSNGPAPTVQHVAATPYASGTNTLVVPIGSAHTLRIAAGSRGATARVTLLGVLGTTGGQFETFPANAIRDGGSTVAIGGSPAEVPLVGVSQVPASGVNSVLVQVTVHSSGQAGSLWVYPGHVTTTPSAPAVIFAGTGSTTATALVRVGPSGTLKLRTSVPGVRVSVDAIGYVTAY